LWAEKSVRENSIPSTSLGAGSPGLEIISSTFPSAEQLAEKLDFALDFGWRSAGVPSTPGFGVMGWSGLPAAITGVFSISALAAEVGRRHRKVLFPQALKCWAELVRLSREWILGHSVRVPENSVLAPSKSTRPVASPAASRETGQAPSLRRGLLHRPCCQCAPFVHLAARYLRVGQSFAVRSFTPRCLFVISYRVWRAQSPGLPFWFRKCWLPWY
jgi:hypothetical protein